MADGKTTTENETTNDWRDADFVSFADLFAPSSETVCEFGDVSLVADDGFHPALKIRVSSCVLAGASSVFKVLFSKRFAEGQIMRAQEEGPAEIHINDPPQTLLLLCQLLHLQGDVDYLDHQQILDLAVAVDKFDCAQALRPAMYGMFTMIDTSDLWELEPVYYMVAAYLLDQPVHFRYWTNTLVLHVPPNTDPVDGILRLLPSNIMPSIRAQRAYVLNELTFLLTDLIEKFNDAAFCAGRPNYTRALTRELAKHELWPLKPASIDLAQQLKTMHSLRIPVMEADVYTQEHVQPLPAWPRSKRSSRSSSYANNQHGYYDADYQRPPSPEPVRLTPDQNNIRLLVERIADHCVGICLDCLKGKEICRVAHASPWKKWLREPVQSSRRNNVWATWSELALEEPLAPSPPVEWETVW